MKLKYYINGFSSRFVLVVLLSNIHDAVTIDFPCKKMLCLGWEGGSIAQWLAYLLPDPAAPGLIPSVPRKKIVDIAEVNQPGCLVERGQWPENVNRTHLVLASSKLVLQKDALLLVN